MAADVAAAADAVSTGCCEGQPLSEEDRPEYVRAISYSPSQTGPSSSAALIFLQM